ncbi:MAG: 4Fe-4S dicluster domain-containing protein [Chloroflexota bacterium]|nr:MAG: 4Fe-4S dicluster domain-containing protein [Chloroflexota bacterium]
MVQYGFFYDQSRCTGCHACSIICKSWNEHEPGPRKWMRVFQWEEGTFPSLRVNALAVPCYHCENPTCIRACPGGAIHKEERFGAVLVDGDRCAEIHREMDCRRCWTACPWGAPQFDSDDQRATMSKCTMCVDRLYDGQTPVCVSSCSLRALDFGKMEDLRKWYGPGDQIEGVPTGLSLKPAVLFKRSDAKRLLVPYDANRALELWRERGPFAAPDLPPVFESAHDVTSAPAGLIGRSKLVLKPRTVEELMYCTRDDE